MDRGVFQAKLKTIKTFVPLDTSSMEEHELQFMLTVDEENRIKLLDTIRIEVKILSSPFEFTRGLPPSLVPSTGT